MVEVRTVEQILRVDHAGEQGAIGIYRAQLSISSILKRRCVVEIKEMLEHERRHHQAFEALLAQRKIRPCRAIKLWAFGGLVLGAVTALLGERAIWVCTAAVENIVNRHLEHQVEFLTGRDPEVLAAVESICDDELRHKQQAVRNGGAAGGLYHVLAAAIRGMTSLAIWLSTKR